MNVDWHLRYQQQSLWTRSLRHYLLQKVSIQPTSNVLEVGCGTGAICSDLIEKFPCNIFGIDINLQSVEIAIRNTPKLIAACCDANLLPFPSGFFEVVYCHYFLLWLANPLKVIAEIKRVLQTGGVFLVFAEPDHSARIDFPSELKSIGKLQVESLKMQGVDVQMGRKIPGLLSQSGFHNIQYGISGFESYSGSLPDWWESEWEVIRNDLESMIFQDRLNHLQSFDKKCWNAGTRILFVPTFYAIGTK